MLPDLYNSRAWICPETVLPLAPAEVQVWRLDLPASPQLFAACEAALNPQERERAERRRQPLDRDHAILGRGMLRQLLSANTGLPPAQIEIVSGPNRKPHTDTSPGLQPGRFAFNIAHSGHIILVALQHGGSIGIDVEQFNLTTPILEIAHKLFTRSEAARLESIAGETLRREAFFDLWTRKEAVVKADGRALLLSLDSFEVTGATVLLPRSSTAFHIHPIPVASGYAAALSTDRLSVTPKLFRFPTQ